MTHAVGGRRDRCRRVLAIDHDAPGAGVERRDGELAAVRAGARQADEQVAGLDLARVDHRPGRSGALGIAGGQLAARELCDARRGQVDHARPPGVAAPARARSASRATSTSSNGSLRPSSNS